MNELATIRKEELEYNPEEYSTNACMQFEKETLGTCITYTPWWDTILPNTQISKQLELKSVSIRPDKNGKNMAFLKLADEGVEFNAIAFASVYKKSPMSFDSSNEYINVQGKKDARGQLVISKVMPLQLNYNPYSI